MPTGCTSIWGGNYFTSSTAQSIIGPALPSCHIQCFASGRQEVLYHQGCLPALPFSFVPSEFSKLSTVIETARYSMDIDPLGYWVYAKKHHHLHYSCIIPVLFNFFPQPPYKPGTTWNCKLIHQPTSLRCKMKPEHLEEFRSHRKSTQGQEWRRVADACEAAAQLAIPLCHHWATGVFKILLSANYSSSCFLTLGCTI